MDQAIDYGTQDRYRHGRVVVEGQDGKALDPEGMRVTRARETHECLMDLLQQRERLGPWETVEGKRQPGEDAARRYDAALWLRSCHVRAGLEPRQVGALEQTSLGKHTLTEAQDWNRRCYRDAMRSMGRLATLVERIAVHSGRCFGMDLVWLKEGLDLLAKHRGIE